MTISTRLLKSAAVVFAVLVACAIAVTATPQSAYAGGLRDFGSEKVVSYDPNPSTGTSDKAIANVRYYNLPDFYSYDTTTHKASYGKVLSCKSSKTSVARVSVNYSAATVTLRGVGTTTLTVKYKTAAGKTRTISFKYKVVKYQNPFTAFKIGTKGYCAKIHPGLDQLHLGGKWPTGALTYKVRSGWTTKITAYSYGTSGSKKTTLKSGSKIPTNTWYIEVVATNKAKGLTETFYIYKY